MVTRDTKTTRVRVLDLLVPLGSPNHAWLQDLLTWLDDATRARDLGVRPNPLYQERVLDLQHASEPTVRLAAALVHVEMLEAEIAAARESAWLARQDDEVTLEHEAGCLHDAWSHDGERWDDLDDAAIERSIAEVERLAAAAGRRDGASGQGRQRQPVASRLGHRQREQRGVGLAARRAAVCRGVAGVEVGVRRDADSLELQPQVARIQRAVVQVQHLYAQRVDRQAVRADQRAATQHRVDERGISYITLNRPDVKNAISPDQRDRVIAMLAEASADLGVRAVVLGHTGDAFCTGADLRASRPPAPRPDDAPKRGVGEVAKMIREGAQQLVSAVLDCEKPVIAAVNGCSASLTQNVTVNTTPVAAFTFRMIPLARAPSAGSF